MSYFDSKHTLGFSGVGPRTLEDAYHYADFLASVSAGAVADWLVDYGQVSEFWVGVYREDRKNYKAMRGLYLGY